MSLRDRLIRALGGYTRADVRKEVDAAKRKKPSLALGAERRLPIRVQCQFLLRREADLTDKLTRENMAYRIGAEMLKANLIAFTPAPCLPDTVPEMQAEAWVMPPGSREDIKQ